MTFYMTPGYHTWDPSIVVFFSFAVFFAMIFADAGYALMLGADTGFDVAQAESHPQRHPHAEPVFGSGCCVGSVRRHGRKLLRREPAEGSVLSSLKVLDMKDQGGMMCLSIIVGVLHLVLANLVTAWRYRRSLPFSRSAGLGGDDSGWPDRGVPIRRRRPAGTALPIDIILLAGGAGPFCSSAASVRFLPALLPGACDCLTG